MKILQLNVWMGKVEGELERFLAGDEFDVICMQEVMSSNDAELQLSRMCVDASRIVKAAGMSYQYFSPNWQAEYMHGHFQLGNMILSKIPFVSQKSEFVHGEYVEDMILGEMPGNNLNVQIVKLENGITVVNHHGFWRPNPTGDAETVASFKKLAEIVKPEAERGPLVLCGDLNIIHASPAMRALDFLRDLTDENGVENTLSGLKFNGEVACDHIMINGGLEAENFIVHERYASDHKGVSVEVKIKE